MRFRLCKGYRMRCCYTCRRFFTSASERDLAQAKGKPDIIPSIYNGKCLDWLPTPPVVIGKPEDRL